MIVASTVFTTYQFKENRIKMLVTPKIKSMKSKVKKKIEDY